MGSQLYLTFSGGKTWAVTQTLIIASIKIWDMMYNCITYLSSSFLAIILTYFQKLLNHKQDFMECPIMGGVATFSLTCP